MPRGHSLGTERSSLDLICPLSWTDEVESLKEKKGLNNSL